MAIQFSPVSFPIGSNITTNMKLTAGDFNEDGLLDFITPYSSDTSNRPNSFGVVLTLGNEADGYEPAQTLEVVQGTPLSALAIADFNGDRHLDVVVSYDVALTETTTISILLGDGAGNLGSPNNLVLRNELNDINAIIPTDVNADDHPDLLVGFGSGSHDGTMLLVNDGAGSFTSSLIFSSSVNPLYVADFTGDGRNDIVTPYFLHIADGKGGFEYLRHEGVPSLSYNRRRAAAGDLNGDGHLDLVMSGSDYIDHDQNNYTAEGRVVVLLNDGTGQLTTTSDILVSVDSYGIDIEVELVDLNADGHLDLLTSSLFEGVDTRIQFIGLFGDGKGNFGTPVPAPFELPTVHLARDANGDGSIDVATVPRFSTEGTLWLNESTLAPAIAIGKGWADAASQRGGFLKVNLARDNLVFKGNPRIRLDVSDVSHVVGTRRGDVIRGDDDDNILYGQRRGDRLIGRDGNDTLVGGHGRDTLIGGRGADRYVFSNQLTYTSGFARGLEISSGDRLGIDRIVGFQPGNDTLVLDQDIFRRLWSDRPLSFAVVDTRREAVGSRARLTYFEGVNTLFYNANGSNPGLGSGGAIARFNTAVELSASDFEIIA